MAVQTSTSTNPHRSGGMLDQDPHRIQSDQILPDQDETLTYAGQIIMWPHCFGERFAVFPICFQTYKKETEFREQLQSHFKRTMLKVAIFPMLVAILFVILRVATFGETAVDPEDDTELWLFGLEIVFIFICAVLLAFERYCPATSESILVLYLIILQAGALASSHYRSSRLLGLHAVQPSDAKLVLGISLLCGTYCLFTRVRVTRAWLASFFGPLAYAAVTFPLPLEEGAPENTIAARVLIVSLLAINAILCLLVSSTIEVRDRQAFLKSKRLEKAAIKEKVLRFRAEHDLEQIPSRFGQDSSSSNRDIGADAFSERTDLSSILFGNVLDPETRRMQWQALEERGQNESWYIKGDRVGCFTDSLLGTGGFGSVVRGTLCGAEVAIKMASAMSDSPLGDLINELRILRHLKHPNVITFFGACLVEEELGPELLLVEELVHGRNLKDAVRNSSDAFDERLQHFALTGICHALLYLHSQVIPVVHGDLKPQNIMIDELGRAKVIDFGLARLRKPSQGVLGASIKYAAPEALVRKGMLECSADVFSFGRLAFFVTTGLDPVSEHEIPMLRKGLVPALQWPDNEEHSLQNTCQEICSKCMVLEQQDRLSIEAVLGSLEATGEHGAPLRPEPLLAGIKILRHRCRRGASKVRIEL